MKILITGYRGMLGQDLVPRVEKAGFNLQCVDIAEMDITKADSVMDHVESAEPDLVINCAAYTAVDKAESEQELAFAVNRDGPGHLADACSKLRIPLVHISTDYVFDGKSSRPYREDDKANPVGVYARSKWEGEEEARTRLNRHIIVRTSWLFGVHGNNFVKTILRLSREKEELRVVADQHGCPTWTGHLSHVLVRLAEKIRENRSSLEWGTYHFCGRGRTTWYDFAACIVEEARKRTRLRVSSVLPLQTSDYPTPAKRPAWSVLDCNKIERTMQIYQCDWHEGLEKVLDSLLGRGS